MPRRAVGLDASDPPAEIASATGRVADINQRIGAVLRDPRDKGELRELFVCLGAAAAATQATFMELLYRPAEARRLLTPQEAAVRLGVSKRWMYDHANELTSTHRLSAGRLRFDSVELMADMARRR